MPVASLGLFCPSAHTPQALWQTARCGTARLASLACQACVTYQCSRAHTIMPPIPQTSVMRIMFSKHLQHGYGLLPFIELSIPLHNWINTQFEIPWESAHVQPQSASLSPSEASRVTPRWSSTVATPVPCSALCSWHMVWALAWIQCTHHALLAMHHSRTHSHPDLRGHWTNKVCLIDDLCEHAVAPAGCACQQLRMSIIGPFLVLQTPKKQR